MFSRCQTTIPPLRNVVNYTPWFSGHETKNLSSVKRNIAFHRSRPSEQFCCPIQLEASSSSSVSKDLQIEEAKYSSAQPFLKMLYLSVCEIYSGRPFT